MDCHSSRSLLSGRADSTPRDEPRKTHAHMSLDPRLLALLSAPAASRERSAAPAAAVRCALATIRSASLSPSLHLSSQLSRRRRLSPGIPGPAALGVKGLSLLFPALLSLDLKRSEREGKKALVPSLPPQSVGRLFCRSAVKGSALSVRQVKQSGGSDCPVWHPKSDPDSFCVSQLSRDSH